MSCSTPSRRLRPENERLEIHSALVEVCLERGYRRASASEVTARAGVGRGAFERHFSNLEDCFVEYIREGRDAFLATVAFAASSGTDWRSQIRAVGYAILDFWRADERRARMMLVEVLSAGTRAQLLRDECMEVMFDLIDRGRGEMDPPIMLTRVTAEALGGAVYNQMRIGLERDGLANAEGMVPQLMYAVVLPYLGPEAALEELAIPPPDP